MGCKKHSPGKPCCQCEGCCLSHIKIEVAVPNDPVDGASLGFVEWDVATQPTIVRTNEVVLGTMQEVCRQTFVAPTSTLVCGSTYAVKLFNTLNRVIPCSGQYHLSLGTATQRLDFTGSETWLENLIISTAQLVLSRTQTHIRVEVSSTGILEYVRFPTPGSVSNFYNASCATTFTINHSDSYTTGLCEATRTNCPAFDLIYAYFPGSLVAGSISGLLQVYTPSLDTGWVLANCGSIPTTPIAPFTSKLFKEYNSNESITDRCRIPASKTKTAGIPSSYEPCPGDAWGYAYNPWRLYNCKDVLTLTGC